MEDKIEKLFEGLRSNISYDDPYYEEAMEFINDIEKSYQEKENILLTIKNVLGLEQNNYSALFKEALDKGIVDKEAYNNVYRKLFKKEAEHTIILEINEGVSEFDFISDDSYTAIKNKINKTLKKHKDVKLILGNSTELLALELLATENYWNIVCEYENKEYKFDPYDPEDNFYELYHLMNKEHTELLEKLERLRVERALS